MPEEPGRDRLGRRLDEKDALPGDEDIVEPRLAVELVEARRARRDEGIGMARGQFATYDHHTGIGDRHDKARTVLADFDAVQRGDINVRGMGRPRMHSYAAADDNAGIG